MSQPNTETVSDAIGTMDLAITSIYGKQNADMLEGAATVYSVILDLMQQGFTVLDFAIRNGKPVIHIQAEKRCNVLDSGTRITRPTQNGQETVKTALVKGCQVEWEVVH